MTTQAKSESPAISIRPPRQSAFSFLMRWEWLLVALIIVVSVVNSLLSPYYLNAANIFRTVSDFMEMGLMMLPMVYIIISANIDLSVASNLAMCASFMGWLFNNGVNIWVAWTGFPCWAPRSRRSISRPSSTSRACCMTAPGWIRGGADALEGLLTHRE